MCIDDGVRVWVEPWRWFKFSGSFRTFSSRRGSLTKSFAETCIHFEVAHLNSFVVKLKSLFSCFGLLPINCYGHMYVSRRLQPVMSLQAVLSGTGRGVHVGGSQC